MTEKLKPCPFCGSENVVISPYDGKNIVICMNCLCKNSGNESREKSIAAWNRRADDSGKTDELRREMGLDESRNA